MDLRRSVSELLPQQTGGLVALHEVRDDSKESSRTAWEELRLRFGECPERSGHFDFAQKFGCAANMSLAAHPIFMMAACRKNLKGGVRGVGVAR